MLPDICPWHRSDKVDSIEINRSIAITRIQSNINPFVFDPSLAARCYCAAYPATPEKSYSVNIYPNPSKGLFYIDIPDYNGPLILKISDPSGKFLETHHLMYSGLMTWRLDESIYILNFSLLNNTELKAILFVKP